MERPPASATMDLSLEDALDCLSNKRRRHTIDIVDASDEPLSLSAVAERVAARQYDVDRDAVTGKQRKAVYTGLYQAHMGKLTAVDAVAFDERAKVLEPAENTAGLAHTLRWLRTQFSGGQRERPRP
ncbi:hypothetical protein G9464_03180 [Halostella sp. JP-L12]|uniref:DUF7344 domain-containing protein n=1 Tax=Halostella TaxID=1843185 RepID=UPI000EF7BE03|nr:MULTISPECIES: hypothetical protein [Halostella]NHN46600.1 hypothetical protein [Halostella sp. JP-L12]